jgi:hypothetical protein
MAKTGFFHHIGSFLLFAAAVLLLITTISAPVIHDIAILKVTLTNQSTLRNSSVTFGTFGYCVLDVAGPNTDQDYCTGKHIGYNPAAVIASIDHTTFNLASEDTSKGLTRVMVLHAVVTGLAFIAFLLALGAGVCGALLASLVAALTWALTVVVLATDLTLFGIIKNHINDTSKDSSGSHAKFSTGLWTLVAAMVALFFATFIVLFTCFSARRHKRDARSTKHADAGYAANGTTTTKRRFWQRRNRY